MKQAMYIKINKMVPTGLPSKYQPFSVTLILDIWRSAFSLSDQVVKFFFLLLLMECVCMCRSNS